MPWTYSQSSGELLYPDSTSVLAVGYSGAGNGKNNPAYQDVPDVGPIPQGPWDVGEPYDDPDTGPFTLSLSPQQGTNTFGRTEFKVHGEAKDKPPGNASEGCIVMPLFARNRLSDSTDKVLQVIL